MAWKKYNSIDFHGQTMNITRRHAIASVFGTALSGLGTSSLRAEFEGPILRDVAGGEDFWLATTPMSTATRWSPWR